MKTPKRAASFITERVERHARTPSRAVALGLAAVVLAALALVVWREPLELRYLRRGPTAGLEAYFSAHPGSRAGTEALGAAYLREGRAADAVRVLGPAVDATPADASLRVLLARALLETGRTADAYAHLQVVLNTLERENSEAHYWLGQLLERAGKQDQARAQYEAVVKEDPRSAPALIRLAALAAADGGTTAAEGFLRRATAVDPRNVTAGAMLAEQLFKLGRANEAAGEARRVLRIRPGDPKASFWLARAALLRDPRGNGQETESALRAATRGSESWMARYYLAKLQRAQGRTAEAVTELRTALREDPLFKDGYYDLAMTQAALGQKPAAAEAMKQFQRLQKIDEEGSALEYQVWADPQNVVLGERLARFYMGTRRPDLAKPPVARLLRVHPDDAGLKHLRAEIDAAMAAQGPAKR